MEEPDLRLAFPAHVDEVGKLHIVEAARWRVTLLTRFKGKDCVLELQRPKRTNQANRRYWGLVVPVAREILSLKTLVPLSKEQTHAVLAGAFLDHIETPLGLVPKPTRKLDTAAFAGYCERIEAHFQQEYGSTFDGAVEL